MGATLSRAVQAERIAERIIRDTRPDLAATRILWLESDAKPSGDHPSAAKASKTTAAEKFLSAPGDEDEAAVFKVVINGELWEELKPAQREALVAHELRHCIWRESEDDEGESESKPALRRHDVEAFVEDVVDYGAWNDDLKLLLEAFRQLPLFADQAAASANGASAYPTESDQARELQAAGLIGGGR